VSEDFVCAACGAKQEHNTIRCERCGKPLVFQASELKGADAGLDGEAARRYAAPQSRAGPASLFGRGGDKAADAEVTTRIKELGWLPE
jgi:hypothetical protein